MCPDEYLDHRVDEERLSVWKSRFQVPNKNQHIVVAEDEAGVFAGFVCTYLNFHKKWGAYLDNLHVAPEYQGLGMGQRLMQKAAEWVKENESSSTLYLHVLKENHGAIRFYERIGGKFIGEVEVDLPWGGKGMVYDYLWELHQLIPA